MSFMQMDQVHRSGKSMEPVKDKEKATMSTKTGDAKVAGSKDLLTVQVPIGEAREKVPDKKYQIKKVDSPCQSKSTIFPSPGLAALSSPTLYPIKSSTFSASQLNTSSSLLFFLLVAVVAVKAL